MSSGRGGEKPYRPRVSGPSLKGAIVDKELSSGVHQLCQGVANVSMHAGQDGGWEEVNARKSKNKLVYNAGNQHVPQNTSSRASGNPGMRNNAGSRKGPSNTWRTPPTKSTRPAGSGNAIPQSSYQGYYKNRPALSPAIGPPLRKGWDWSTRAASSQSSDIVEDGKVDEVDVDADDDSDLIEDSDGELMSDGSDSDASEKSHETCMKNRWFKELFKSLDNLTIDQINEPERQWHCPACKGGPGAIDWYNGLQPLITHAKTKVSGKMKLHRKLAGLLEEELRRKGASLVPSGESFGEWEGLDGKVEREIVWPPMVIIMNTRLERDEHDKWRGMGNQELLQYFSSYDAKQARHSYGPQGHRGMSVLIFEASAVGYFEAERLSKHLEDTGKGKTAWESGHLVFAPGGKRQLYGYMAEKRDLDYFNQHSQGKSKVKFGMRSYQEMVVNQLKRINEDNQQLIWFKSKVAKEQRHSKALEQAYGIVSEKYRRTLEENRIVRQRIKMHHEQSKMEMDSQELFFKEQLKIIYEAREAKEEDFENLQQEERQTMTQSHGDNCSSMEDHTDRVEKIANFIQSQDRDMEEFFAEREKLIKVHEEKMLELKRRHWEAEVALEKDFDAELSQLMKKYTRSM